MARRTGIDNRGELPFPVPEVSSRRNDADPKKPYINYWVILSNLDPRPRFDTFGFEAFYKTHFNFSGKADDSPNNRTPL